MAKDEMLTAGKIATKLGVPANKVKQFITDRKIKPDQKKGACAYYGPATVKKIQKGLGK